MCSNHFNKIWGPFKAVELASILPHDCTPQSGVVVDNKAIQFGLINIHMPVTIIGNHNDVDLDVKVDVEEDDDDD